MGIHEEICRNSLNHDRGDHSANCLHDEYAAEAAEAAVYTLARSLGHLSTEAARIAAAYGRTMNI